MLGSIKIKPLSCSLQTDASLYLSTPKRTQQTVEKMIFVIIVQCLLYSFPVCVCNYIELHVHLVGRDPINLRRKIIRLQGQRLLATCVYKRFIKFALCPELCVFYKDFRQCYYSMATMKHLPLPTLSFQKKKKKENQNSCCELNFSFWF